MTGYHAAGRRVDLGNPEHISDPPTRDIYVRLGEISASTRRMERDDVMIDDQLRDAANAKPAGVAAAIWAGESIDADMDADAGKIMALRAERERVTKLLAAQREAERMGVVKLNKAIDDAAGKIAKSSLRKLAALPAKLAMVERVLSEVMDTHDATAGLIHLLEERKMQGGALTVRHIMQTPRVELGLAQEHVKQGIAKLTAEIEAAQETLKARKGKKASVVPEVVSEAHSLAQPASARVADPIGFEIGEDEGEGEE